MKHLAHKLKNRVQIVMQYQIPSAMFTKQAYRTLIRLWAQIIPLNISREQGLAPIRSQNTDDSDTHDFVVRWTSVKGVRALAFADGYGLSYENDTSQGLGRQFDRGFDGAFDSWIDFDPVKASYFVYVEGNEAYQGRLFKINRVVRDDNYKEFVMLRTSQTEERGTGACTTT